MSKALEIEQQLVRLGDPMDAAFLQRFFKTGPGEYGEGDQFLGIRVPKVRAVAKEYYKNLANEDIEALMGSPWHEARLCGLVIMTLQYQKASEPERKILHDMYISFIGKGINNWDLVDVSCVRIVGAYLYDKDRAELYDLSDGDLWHKRVSLISTFYFVRYGDFGDSLKLCEKLVYDKHDLIQKAVGWLLREVGKKDDALLRNFLDKFAATMPRIALRYALEKQPEPIKAYYMSRHLKYAN